MASSLAHVLPGWELPATPEFAAAVSAGLARESTRLRGSPFVLALALSEFDSDGLTESLQLLAPVDSLEAGAARAEAEARVRADKLRDEYGWQELSVGGARALAPFRDAPFLAVRKVGDGSGFNSIYVRVAVLPLDPAQPLGLGFVRAVGLDGELASYLAGVGANAPA